MVLNILIIDVSEKDFVKNQDVVTFTGSDEVITKGENYYNQTYNNENTNGTSTS